MTKAPSTLPDGTVLDRHFTALCCLLALVSFLNLALLALGVFTPLYVAIGGVFMGLGVWWSFGRGWFLGSLRWQEWVVVAVALAGVALRSNPATYLYGGQDPGVYSSMAGHFARTGSLVMRDPILPDLNGSEDIRSYYLTTSILRLRQSGPQGSWVGNMLPGVYLHNLEKNEWVFQFYALHPSWLAIGRWIFGVEGQGWALVLFSALSIVAGYLVTRRVTGNDLPGICVAILLATNPAHSYMATFPVSETIAGFFFLATIYLLLRNHFIFFLAPLTALFLTRITGFLTAPLLLGALAWMVVKRRDRRAALAGIGVLFAYAVSFYWGLWFSPNYSIDIYRGKLGLTSSMLSYAWLVFLGLGFVWSGFCYVVFQRWQTLESSLKLIVRNRRAISVSIVAIVFLAALGRGYLLAFTDHYNAHRWFARRWGMAGHGVGSVGHLSLYTLGLMLSPLGLLAFVGGLCVLGARACARASLAPLVFLTAGFSGALLVVQLTTPYLYYYGRYLVSELVPLAVVCAVVFIESARQRFPVTGRFIFPAYTSLVVALLSPALLARLSLTEAQEFSRAVECIDLITPGDGVVIIDKQDLAFGSYPLATPLRVAFGKRTFSIRYGDFASHPERLRNLIEYFKGRGEKVYVLSSHDVWERELGFKRLIRLPMTMRTLGGRKRLPRRVATRSHPMRVYSLEDGGPTPPLCEQVLGQSA